jgi:DNA-binding response OmpR family regulator
VKELPSHPVLPARILVVDDESMPRMAVTRALNLMGYKAEEAASGADALVKMSARFYDLLLLDLRMPGMDGVEVMQQVRTLYPDTLMIVLTAHATLQSAIAAVRFGAVDYLLKPYSLHDTEAAIARALEGRRLREVQTLAAPDEAERFVQGGLIMLDLERRLAIIASPQDKSTRQVELTRNEAFLLARLIRSPDMVFSCRDLARNPLGYDVNEHEAEEIIRPHISRLRNKVEPDPAHPTLIRTIHGKGYRFSA